MLSSDAGVASCLSNIYFTFVRSNVVTIGSMVIVISPLQFVLINADGKNSVAFLFSELK